MAKNIHDPANLQVFRLNHPLKHPEMTESWGNGRNKKTSPHGEVFLRMNPESDQMSTRTAFWDLSGEVRRTK